MSKTKIVLETSGIRELLKSHDVKECIHNESIRIREACGTDGYETDVKYMGTRVISSVYTTSEESLRDNLENNTLLKNIKG